MTAPLVLAAVDGYFALVGDDDRSTGEVDRIPGRMTHHIGGRREYVIGFSAARPVTFTLPPDSDEWAGRVGFYATDGRLLWTSAWFYGLKPGDTLSVTHVKIEPRRVG